jgi:hypothetical protein
MEKFRAAIAQLIQADPHQTALALISMRRQTTSQRWEDIARQVVALAPKPHKTRLLSVIQQVTTVWREIDQVLSNPLDEAVTITVAALSQREMGAQRLFFDALVARSKSDIKAQALIARLILLLESSPDSDKPSPEKRQRSRKPNWG